MAPANERLEPDDLTGRQLDDRLVVELERLGLDGGSQLGLHLEAALGSSLHRRIEDDMPTLALVLGRVHRGIGMGQQIPGQRVTAARERDPDADPNDEWPPFEHDRATDRDGEPFRQGDDLLLAVDAFDQDRELVATLASGDVVGPDRHGESLGDLDEEAVAGPMPERVVDDLEVVDVEEQDRDPGPTSA